jgi:hypothetical protein
MGDDGEREKLSWAEIDKRRDKARTSHSPPGDSHPRGRRAQERAARESRDALAQADALFSGDPGGEEGAALAKAVRDAHGTPELEPACRAYMAALGVPAAADLLSIMLDTGQTDLMIAALEQLFALKQTGKLEMTGGLKAQLRLLAQEPNDDVAGLSEDLLAQ